MAHARKSLGAAAGLFAGPAAWLLNTELGYALVPLACARGLPLTAAASAAMLAVALAGGGLSLREWRRSPGGPHADGGEPDRMLAGVGVLAAAIFGLVILVQGAAGVVFDGCER